LISAVSYDDHSFIVETKTHDDYGDNISNSRIEKRIEVVAKLNDKKTYCTILKNNDGKWQKGEKVDIIKVNGREFIRTDRNQKESDNLGNLPKF
jgi:Protein of unknown function (DUF3892)